MCVKFKGKDKSCHFSTIYMFNSYSILELLFASCISILVPKKEDKFF